MWRKMSALNFLLWMFSYTCFLPNLNDPLESWVAWDSFGLLEMVTEFKLSEQFTVGVVSTFTRYLCCLLYWAVKRLSGFQIENMSTAQDSFFFHILIQESDGSNLIGCCMDRCTLNYPFAYSVLIMFLLFSETYRYFDLPFCSPGLFFAHCTFLFGFAFFFLYVCVCFFFFFMQFDFLIVTKLQLM